jgi:hypothetical protein
MATGQPAARAYCRNSVVRSNHDSVVAGSTPAQGRLGTCLRGGSAAVGARNTSCAVCLAPVPKVREGTEGCRARRRLAQILGTGLLLVTAGTTAYTVSQDWSLVDGFYFAVATLTTSSIADPHLVITRRPIKIFTVYYILVGIGILVELVRQIGFAYVEVRRAEKATKDAKADAGHQADT